MGFVLKLRDYIHLKTIAHITKDQEFVKLIKAYEESLVNSNWVFEIFDNYEGAFDWCNK